MSYLGLKQIYADETVIRLKEFKDVTIPDMYELKKHFPNLSLASPFRIPNEILVHEYLVKIRLVLIWYERNQGF